MEIRLFDRPVAEAARLVGGGGPVWLLVNPVEYHGPHLPLHTDRLLATAVARDVHARLGPGTPLLLADDLELGVGPTPGLGTRATSVADARRAVIGACRTLLALGASRVALATFHGDPAHNLVLEEGVRWLRARGVRAAAPFHLVVRSMLGVDPHEVAEALAPLGPADRAEAMERLGSDYHAGFFETSLMLHYHPDKVDPAHRALAPCPRPVPLRRLVAASRVVGRLGAAGLSAELRVMAEGLGWARQRPFLGYTWRPDLANAASGAAFARSVVDRYVACLDDVWGRGSAPPRPLMAWAAPFIR